MKRITANKLLAQIIAIKNLYLYPHTATSLSINLLSSFLCFTSDLYSDRLCTVAEAMAKCVAAFFLALIALSMLQTLVMSSHGHGGHHYNSQRRYGPGSLKSYQCPSQCSRRCSKTQYHKPCMFFCQKCCRKCLCVPPGYYGNKAVCPCYNNWKTKEGGPKCP